MFSKLNNWQVFCFYFQLWLFHIKPATILNCSIKTQFLSKKLNAITISVPKRWSIISHWSSDVSIKNYSNLTEIFLKPQSFTKNWKNTKKWNTNLKHYDILMTSFSSLPNKLWSHGNLNFLLFLFISIYF